MTREEAIKNLKSIKKDMSHVCDEYDAIQLAIHTLESVNSFLKEVSSMDLDRVHWIHMNDDFNDWLECSRCGYGSEGEVKYGQGTNFCPNCGADMRGD